MTDGRQFAEGGGDVAETDIAVVLVDDERQLVEMTATYLTEGHEAFAVAAYTDVEAALDHIAGEPVDCVVSDYDMPGTNGLQFLDRVRHDFPELPFILYTGRGSEEIASEAISRGVTDYLQKRSTTDQYELLANRIENAVSRHRAQAALERREQWYRALIENSTDIVAVLDEDAVFRYLSPSIEWTFGYKPEALEGEQATGYIHPSDRTETVERFTNILANESVRNTEFRFRHADGGWRWLEGRGTNRLDDPVVGGIVINTREITKRKERERELETEQAFIESVLNALPDSFYVLDMEGFVRRWNRRLEEVTGYTADEMDGKFALELIPPADHELIFEAMQRVYQGSVEVRRSAFVTKSGEYVPQEFNGAPITDPDGTVIGLAGTARQITDHAE